MTELLYYRDATLLEFSATVRSVEPAEGGYRVLLDRSAFFPCEGGQGADHGTLGGVAVTDVLLCGDELVHVTAEPLLVGTAVPGRVDAARRRRHMQVHTGEHILSGVLCRMYGATNVGFHLGETEVTLDLDVFLDAAQLAAAEEEANRAVFENRAVRILYPASEDLPTLNYRSKLELTENVRLVEIEGVDLCACCAPHVARTGEVGLIKIISSMRYKGGVRLHIAVGVDALSDYRARCESVHAASVALSAPESEIAPAIDRVLMALTEEKHAVSALRAALRAERLAAASAAAGGGDLYLSYPDLDPIGLRSYAEEGMAMTDGLVLVAAPADGGCRYALASRTENVKKVAAGLHEALGGRGGGRPELVQGSVPVDFATLLSYFGRA